MSIDLTLIERNITHGDFTGNAIIAQAIKKIISDNGRSDLNAVMQESLDLIVTKISRILCTGGINIDDWHDIAGYATLVEQSLRR